MANSITTDGSKWLVNLDVTSSSGIKKTLTTAGTYVDRNIEVDVNVAAADFKNSATAGVTYTEVEAGALVSKDYLYIDAGYTGNAKISLASLVPDDSNVKGKESLMYKTVQAYDNDGVLVTGTMDDSTPAVNVSLPSGKTSSGTINLDSYIKIPAGRIANDLYYKANSQSSGTKATVTSGSASITSLTYTYDSTNKRYNVTGSGTVAAPTVNTAGYISSSAGTKNTNTASVSATVAETNLSKALVADTSKTSGYSVYRATASAGYNAAAKTSDITVYQGTWS